jgi:alanine racemase
MVSATIDTGALRHNLAIIRRRAPKSRVMAVIKANAYGHGLIRVARALEAADAFAVARVEEALALREAGIRTSILLLEGVLTREQLDAAAGADLELVVHTPEQIELLRAAAEGAQFKVWLKLDSGMNRLGFKGEAFQAAYLALSTLPALRAPVNLITHLASADRP